MTQDASAPRAAIERVRWVDHSRGLAIFLVVFGHSLGGLMSSGAAGGPVVAFVMGWIYAFHVPVFFFASGLFAARAAARPWPVFLSEKCRSVVYPYVVWATLQTCFQAMMGRYVNYPVSFWAVLRLPYDPPAQFWFLYALFLIMLIHALAVKAGLRPGILFLLSVGAAILVALCSLGPWRGAHLAGGNLVYFALGAWAAEKGQPDRWRQTNALGLAIRCGVLYLAVAVAVASGWSNVAVLKPLWAAFGIGATVCAALMMERVAVSRVVEHWGRRSLEIYVAHVVFSAGARIGVRMTFGPQWVLLQFAGSVAMGIYGPLALEWFARRLRFPYLFSLRRR